MSGIATGTALAIGLGTSAAAGIGTSLIGAHAAGSAANAQANSANYAADLQKQQADEALKFQQEQYGQSQRNLYPYLQAGTGGLANLAYLLGIPMNGQSGGAAPNAYSAPNGPNSSFNGSGFNGGAPMRAVNGGIGPTANGTQPDQGIRTPVMRGGTGTPTPNGAPSPITLSNGTSLPQLPSLSSMVNPNLGAFGSLSQGWDKTFQAPTAEEAAKTPGYQFQLGQGQQAIQRSAAASGNLLSGGTLKSLDQYSQGLASQNYGDVYNRALGQYQLGYNQFENNQANLYNRLASLAGLGQVSANQLNSAGQTASGNVGNILLSSGQQIGQNINNAGAARASGYVGGANAISGGLNSVSQLPLLLSLMHQGGGGGGVDWSQVDGGFGGM